MNNKRPPLDPATQRIATETLAHTGEARRMIADLAKSRGAPTPAPGPTLTGFEDIAEEITGMHKEVAAIAKAERDRANRSDSDSPGNAMSVRGPGGISMRRAPAWLVLAVVIVAALAYVVGQIAGHPKPESVPVTLPAHS